MAAFLLAEKFLPSQIAPVLDGRQTDQMAKARASRTRDQEKAAGYVEHVIEVVTERTLNRDWPSGTLVTNAQTKLLPLFVLTSDSKDRFSVGLRIQIPHMFKEHFLFIPESDVLTTVVFTTEEQLLLFAIVSNNEYSKNIESLGLVRNRSIITNVATSPENLDDLDILLAKYMKKAREVADDEDMAVPVHFESARVILKHQRPTFTTVGSASNARFDDLQGWPAAALRLRTASILDRSEIPSSEMPFYTGHNTTFNQSRSYFSDKGTILTSEKRQIDATILALRGTTEPRREEKEERCRNCQQNDNSDSRDKKQEKEDIKNNLNHLDVLQLDVEHLVQQVWPWPLSPDDEFYQLNLIDRLDIIPDFTLYRQLVAYLLNGEQGAGSQYQRRLNAPSGRFAPVTTQQHNKQSQATTLSPSIRAVPVVNTVRAIQCSARRTTISHLAAKTTFTAMKGHYLNSIAS
ncbi:hypothetical protein BGZ47_005507 [Haplosporangium gracile]|nr:hypothetical protein BGZ47_005507 [Haplosporangium gracile]